MLRTGVAKEGFPNETGLAERLRESVGEKSPFRSLTGSEYKRLISSTTIFQLAGGRIAAPDSLLRLKKSVEWTVQAINRTGPKSMPISGT